MIVNVNGQLFVDLQKLQIQLGITPNDFTMCLITFKDAEKYIDIHAKKGSENELKKLLRSKRIEKLREIATDE